MPTETVLAPVVRYLRSLRFEDLPSTVTGRALDVVLDTVGCILGGLRVETGAIQARALERLAGAGPATVPGLKRGLDPVSAVLINATLADVLDYEDTIVGLAHPSAAIVPAALAIGEATGASGREVLTAVVAGYEIGVRIGRAVLPSLERSLEVPVSQAWNAFGAVAVASKLLDLTEEATLDAFGYAGATSPLPTWYSRWGRPLHWIKGNYGAQARAGVLGALLAREGVRGPRYLLDSDLGFWRMIGSDRFEPAALTQGLGDQFETLGIHFKPYPICHFLHPTVEIVRTLARRDRLTPNDVAEVVVRSFHYMTDWFADPAPASLVDAQFSVPYAVAVALLDVPVGPVWYEPETLEDPRIRALALRVRVEGSAEADSGFAAGLYPTEVTVTTRDGRRFNGSEGVPEGSPNRPLAAGDLERKFHRLADPVLGRDGARRAWGEGTRLPSATRIADWTTRLIPGAS